MARKRLVLYVTEEAHARLAEMAQGDRRSMSERGAMILDDLLTQPLVQPTSGMAVGMQDARRAEQERLGLTPSRSDVDTRRTEPPDDPVLVVDPEFQQ